MAWTLLRSPGWPWALHEPSEYWLDSQVFGHTPGLLSMVDTWAVHSVRKLWCFSEYYCVYFFFWYTYRWLFVFCFKTESYYVALVGLGLTMWMMMPSDSWKSTCLCTLVLEWKLWATLLSTTNAVLLDILRSLTVELNEMKLYVAKPSQFSSQELIALFCALLDKC